MKLRSWLVCLVLGLFSLFLVSSVGAKISPSPTPTTAMSSFELFWPLVAGKTRTDSFYWLKRVKESVQGLFLFAKPQQAQYQVLLATKRVLEAEKLFNENKNVDADKTLGVAQEEISKAQASVESYLTLGASLPADISTEIKNKLRNLDEFLTWFSSKINDNNLKTLLDSVRTLQNKI